MELDIVWHGGSGKENNVRKAFLAHTADEKMEERLASDLHPDHLVVVYDDSVSDSGYLDDESGRRWQYFEAGSIVAGKSDKGAVLATVEGNSEENVESFEYSSWAEEEDLTHVEVDGELIELEGEVSYVDET